jgi:hypothetical protein
MATTIRHNQARAGTAGQGMTRAAHGNDGRPLAARLTTEQVWHQVVKASFAVLGTAAGRGRWGRCVIMP